MEPGQPPRLRIATFNVENLGAEVDQGPSLQDRVRVLRPQLSRLRADVLCLQEVDGRRPAPGEDRILEALDAVVAGTPYERFARAATLSRSTGAVRDKHNLVILSRFPILHQEQVFHHLVAPPRHRIATAEPGEVDTIDVAWDRPVLYAAVALAPNRTLHVINVHLRAPRAAFIPGHKTDTRAWRSMAGWAEGFFLAAVKRAGQALEVRLFLDRLFDAEPEPLIAVCGDFNADVREMPVRIIRGDEEDAANPHLVLRTLVPVERSLADSRRFSVVHHGRPQMLDHVLVSRALLGWYRNVEIHNEALGDELITPHVVAGSPESFHAPVIAEFRVESGGCDDAG
ncbi:MAG: endonuclease [Rhodospirillales bacterium]|nr:MAG: endonuclease [Rhodospirillales bacterium]